MAGWTLGETFLQCVPPGPGTLYHRRQKESRNMTNSNMHMQAGKRPRIKTDEIALVTQVQQSSCISKNTSKDNGDPDVLPRGPQTALKNLRASKQVSKDNVQ